MCSMRCALRLFGLRPKGAVRIIAVPGLLRAHLILVQSHLILGLLIALFDLPAALGHPHDLARMVVAVPQSGSTPGGCDPLSCAGSGPSVHACSVPASLLAIAAMATRRAGVLCYPLQQRAPLSPPPETAAVHRSRRPYRLPPRKPPLHSMGYYAHPCSPPHPFYHFSALSGAVVLGTRSKKHSGMIA
jgi:hypothetical protein